MGPVLTLLVIGLVSLIIIRVGTLALVITGMSQDAASFQAISAFFGVGFTTRESEMVVAHPVRRRVIRDLIICGNIGLTGVLATVIATAVRFEDLEKQWLRWALLLFGGVAILFLLTKLGFVRRLVDYTIRASLRRAGLVKAVDYDTLLRVGAGFSVSDTTLKDDHPLVGRTLGDTKLRSHGVVVLGIARADGAYVGVPHGDTRLEPNDTLTVYGRDAAVQALADGTIDTGPTLRLRT